MKTIKIKYIGFWDGFTPEKNVFTKTILENYNVVECDDPDYIICSCFNNKEFYEYCNYPQVRIMYSGENYIPDFNFVDYAISPYPIVFQDRHFRYPICFDDYNGRFNDLLKKERNYSKEDLSRKIYFANFIASHDSEDNLRGDFYKQLSDYKRVEAFGSYLNNQPLGQTVDIYSKEEVQRQSKFTLCFESTKHEGFITEKIADAFFSDTIPVYYGSEDVKNIFNEEAFIFCKNRSDFNRVIQRIIELDNDDELYLEMLRKPIFRENDYAKNINRELSLFIRHIFNQPVDQAYRRSNWCIPQWHEKFIQNAHKTKKSLQSGKIVPINNKKLVVTSLLKSIKKEVGRKISKKT